MIKSLSLNNMSLLTLRFSACKFSTFLGAERVGNMLDGVAEAVGEVVGGVDAPLVPRPVVRRELNAVRHRVLLPILHHVLHSKRGLKIIAKFKISLALCNRKNSHFRPFKDVCSKRFLKVGRNFNYDRLICY